MNTTTHDSSHPQEAPWQIVVVGCAALAVAMGIGRFAFTPLLPLMLRDHIIETDAAAEWAAANYLGYLVGALTAAWFAASPRRGLLLGQTGVAVTTLGIAWLDNNDAMIGVALRAITGICSAWILVCTTAWCLGALARHRSLNLGGWIYTGVGLGIALTGIIAWLGGAQSARSLWTEFGILAMVGAIFTLPSMWRQSPAPQHVGANASMPANKRRNMLLVFCYGTFGFGYIVPATYLPTMARQLVSNPLVFGLTWPVFGLAAALSVAVVARWLPSRPRQQVWASAQGVMAIGTLLPLLQQSLLTLLISAILVGGTFMVATMAGFQLARESMPANPTPLLARMTASFATGQILGPVMIRAIGPGQIASWDALHWASAIATILLALTATWLWRDTRVGDHHVS